MLCKRAVKCLITISMQGQAGANKLCSLVEYEQAISAKPVQMVMRFVGSVHIGICKLAIAAIAALSHCNAAAPPCEYTWC